MIVEKVIQDYEQNYSILFCKDTPKLYKTKMPSYPEDTEIYLGKDNIYHIAKERQKEIKSFDMFYSEVYADIPLKKIDELLNITINRHYDIYLCYKEHPYNLHKIKNAQGEEVLNIQEVCVVAEITSFEKRKEEIKYITGYVLQKEKENSGSTCFKIETIYQKTNKYLKRVNKGISKDEFIAYLNYWDTVFYVYTEPHKSIPTKVSMIKDYEMEHGIYMMLKQRDKQPTPFSNYNVEDAQGNYSNQQKKAIETLVTHEGCISILTGGPGSGKTTILKEIVRNMRRSYPREKIAMLAPTGKAAKRIQEVMEEEDISISTIHKFLDYQKIGEEYQATTDKESLAEIRRTHFVIIDEASMLSIYLFMDLLRYLDLEKTKIILVGDAGQLPSIEAGCLLNDLINLKVYTVRLDSNYRSGGTIVENSRKMEKGDTNFIYDENFILTDEELPIREIIRQESALILSPFKTDKKEDSTDKINKKAHEIRFENYAPVSSKYRSGDKVIVTRTRYQNGEVKYVNGDTGVVISSQIVLAKDNYTLAQPSFYIYEVEFEEYTTYVSESDLDFGDALTIHKSQGSEFEDVHIVITSYEPFITKKMFYTAVTRAKKRVFIYSTPEIIQQIIKNDKDGERETILQTEEKFK